MMNAGDAALVAQVRRGDRAAFGTLVERHRPAAVRLAAHLLGQAAEAEDAVQDACLQAFLSLERLRDPGRFGAWLNGITVNLCRMRLRARRTVYSLEDWEGGRLAAGLSAGDLAPSVEAAYEVRELHRRVVSAIDQLPADQRAAVRLYYLDGLTLDEIGVLAGAPAGTVKARLHRARARLRALLADERPPARSKEIPMIEVFVDKVVMRVPRPPRDVVEAAGPGPIPEGMQPFNIPLPPPPPGMPPMPGQGIFFVRGDENEARATGRVPPFLHRVVLLKEKAGQRVLPIWIGPHEGDMLAMQLAEKSAPRPMTYELTARLLELAGARLERVDIHRLHKEVFYAALHLHLGGQTHQVDARPSDALNLALRLQTPVFVAPEIMDSQAVLPEGLDQALGGEAAETGAQFFWMPVPPPDLAPSPPPET